VFVPAFKAVLHDTIAPALARHEQVLLCNPVRGVWLQTQTPSWIRRLQHWLHPTQLSDLLQ